MGDALSLNRGERTVADCMKCELCNEDFTFQWSDTHGVGVCVTCGLPYRIYHYEGDGSDSKRVDKPPEVAIRDEAMPLARAYWAEKRRRVFPACYDMLGPSPRSGGRTYSGATADDVREFDGFVEAHPELAPPKRHDASPSAGDSTHRSSTDAPTSHDDVSRNET